MATPRQKGRKRACWSTDCLGTKSKRMRFSSWSSSSITVARGYMCSMSKWNWTPAGGSRRKFLLSYNHSVQIQQPKQVPVSPRGAHGVCSYCRQSKDLLLDGLLLVIADPGRHSYIWKWKATCANVNKCVQHQMFDRCEDAEIDHSILLTSRVTILTCVFVVLQSCNGNVVNQNWYDF